MLARRFQKKLQCFMNVFYAHNAFLYSFYVSEIIYNECNQLGEQSDQCVNVCLCQEFEEIVVCIE